MRPLMEYVEQPILSIDGVFQLRCAYLREVWMKDSLPFIHTCPLHKNSDLRTAMIPIST